MKISEIEHYVLGARGPGIGCVLVRSEGTAMITACGLYTSIGKLTTDKPPRLCSKCRGALYKVQKSIYQPAPRGKDSQ